MPTLFSIIKLPMLGIGYVSYIGKYGYSFVELQTLKYTPVKHTHNVKVIQETKRKSETEFRNQYPKYFI